MHAHVLHHSDLGSLDGWTFAQRLLGVTTHYKLHREDGSITIRIQGELTGCSVFDQVRKTARMMGGGWLLSSACTNERVVDTTTTRHTHNPLT